MPRDRLQVSLELLAGEMRRRCHETSGLPDGEQAAWEVVSGQRGQETPSIWGSAKR